MAYGTIKVDTIENTNGLTGNAIGPGFKNRIINGDMRIDQRATSVSPNTGGQFYSVDRFYGTAASSAGVFSLAQNTSAPTGFINSIKATVTTADASIGSSNRYAVRQAIEGTNISDFAWGSASAKTVTLSFWVRSSLTGTFGGILQNGAGDRTYVFSYSISAADTWEQKTVTIAGDTSGTWLTTTGTGITLSFSLGAGSSLVNTAGSWYGANYQTATGATSVIGTLNATWYITGVQLEVGPSATSFDYRPYGTELALCQRYCVVYTGVIYGYYQFGSAYSTTRAITMVGLPVTMRTTPALTTTGNFRLHDTVNTIAVTAFVISNASANIFGIDSTVASGLTQFRPYFLGSNNDTTAQLIASAEL